MEGDEISAQFRAATLVQADGEGLGRAVAGGEGLPRGFRARLAIERDALLERQFEVLAQQLRDARGAAPLEW